MLPAKQHLSWAGPWAAAIAVVLASALILGASAPAPTTTQAATQHAHAATAAAVAAQTMPAPTSDTPAATLRSNLNLLLQEHVYLAGAATGAALGGRMAEFEAAAGALDANSVALSEAIGSVYGDAAEQAFLPLWRAHITMFVDYTQATAAGDAARKAKALSDLDAYRTDFDAFLSGANPNLPRGAVAALLAPHVTQLAAAIDAQAANDPTRAYLLLREAAGHMHMIGDPLTEAIVKQFPQRFMGQMHLQSLAEPAAQGPGVEVRQFAFNPNTLQVPVGATVTWTNRDGAQHSITEGMPGAPGGAFDSGLIGEGTTFSQSFTQAGTYSYFCQRHASMQGQIEVVG